ncbi:PaaI family thioesterase [Pseudobacillus sp. FSL P4-0506]|uniref:PaaI family thioesterase n=1 Tax=unclassified Pseudobacillus TaxID=2619284 RepID=UPI0030FA1DC7
MLLEDILKEFEECPFLHHLGLEIVRFEEGNVQIKLSMKDYLLNTNHTLHGGVYASILDFIQSMHLRSVTKTRCVTTSSTVHFVAPVTGGEILAEAEVISKGHKMAFVEGTMKDREGKLIAKGTGTFKLIQPASLDKGERA